MRSYCNFKRGVVIILMANNRIAYGIAQRLGINTDGMSPKEVWAAIKRKKGHSQFSPSKTEEKIEQKSKYTSAQYKTAKKRLKKIIETNKNKQRGRAERGGRGYNYFIFIENLVREKKSEDTSPQTRFEFFKNGKWVKDEDLSRQLSSVPSSNYEKISEEKALEIIERTNK